MKASIEDKGDWVLINGWMLYRKDKIVAVRKGAGIAGGISFTIADEKLSMDFNDIDWKEFIEALTGRK